MSDGHDGTGANPQLGSTPAFQYWNDLISTSQHLFQKQAIQWIGIWQQMMGGNYQPSQMLPNALQLWAGWTTTAMELSAFPFVWANRRSMNVPSLLFVVDAVAQATDPQSAPTAITVPDAPAAVDRTDLQPIAGVAATSGSAVTSAIDRRHVDVTLDDGGNRVSVRLLDLGSTADERRQRGIVSGGHYMGVVYMSEGSATRPLALVIAIFL